MSDPIMNQNDQPVCMLCHTCKHRGCAAKMEDTIDASDAIRALWAESEWFYDEHEDANDGTSPSMPSFAIVVCSCEAYEAT